ncbi:MAG: methionyl-tRNA formyltransferase [Spirochaetaceae bacterium]|jgi:methionyl-tRNA formyltransferase|nr:methionyl-tRNA formyltransferase [Spirochaetaceae bacterium]
MRILFAGTPALAVPSLTLLAQHSGGNFELAGILTKPDSLRGGRQRQLVPSDIGAAAAFLLPQCRQLKPEKLDSAARLAVAELKPDLLVSFAYGHIFGPRFLSLFPCGGINVHPSLLPKYRGPSPLTSVILHRELETGISIQRLALAMDSGTLLAQKRFPLTGCETTASLSDSTAALAADLLLAVVQSIADGTMLEEKPQNHEEASYCRLFSKEDGLIDWSKTALDLDAQIRAFTPWPLSFTTHCGRYLYILESKPMPDTSGDTSYIPGTVIGTDKQGGLLIQTGSGLLGVQRLQYQTKKALPWRDFLNGAPDFPGAVLGG